MVRVLLAHYDENVLAEQIAGSRRVAQIASSEKGINRYKEDECVRVCVCVSVCLCV